MVRLGRRKAVVLGKSHGMWSVGMWWVEAELDRMQDNKHQCQILLAQILDAMEHSMPSHQHGPATPTLASLGVLRAHGPGQTSGSTQQAIREPHVQGCDDETKPAAVCAE